MWQWASRGVETLLLYCLLAASSNAQAALPEAVQRIKPSVVVVGTYQRTRSPAFVFMGTGFIVGDGTLVATNAHVKLRQALNTEQFETLVVALPSNGGTGAMGDTMREVTRLVVDEQHDLALLKLKSGPALPAAGFSTAEVREGRVHRFHRLPDRQRSRPVPDDAFRCHFRDCAGRSSAGACQSARWSANPPIGRWRVPHLPARCDCLSGQ